MLNVNDNPYAPPCDNSKGHYDLTLAKRIFLAFAAIAIWYLLIVGVASWQNFSESRGRRTVLQQIELFFLDWKADPRLR